jgi:hypothetical protein
MCLCVEDRVLTGDTLLIGGTDAPTYRAGEESAAAEKKPRFLD